MVGLQTRALGFKAELFLSSCYLAPSSGAGVLVTPAHPRGQVGAAGSMPLICPFCLHFAIKHGAGGPPCGCVFADAHPEEGPEGNLQVNYLCVLYSILPEHFGVWRTISSSDIYVMLNN